MNAHLRSLVAVLGLLEDELPRIDRWGRDAAAVLGGGGRLLAAGNGGSAVQAEHLTGELVGRYRDDRRPLSAIALHTDHAAATAIVNDYGPDAAFARPVRAHGRPGDLLVALSTSGRSANVLAAVDEARAVGLTSWALTGPRPNPLAERCDDVVAIPASTTATVQEVHLVVVHLLCESIDAHLDVRRPTHVCGVVA